MSKEVTDNLRSARKELQRRLNSLRKEVELVKADIDAIDRMLGRYGEQQSLTLSNGRVSKDSTEFIGLTLRESVLKVLEEQRPMPVRAAEIEKQLLGGGYRTKSENFNSAIFATLSKLVHDDLSEKIAPGLYVIKGFEKDLEEELDEEERDYD